MKPEELTRMRDLEAAHWWFLGRRYLLRFLRDFLVRSDSLILDAGCGTGLAASELGGSATVVGLDVCDEAFRISDWKPLGIPCVGSVEGIPFADCSFDLVAALDVLEHLDDAESALREMYRICKPGGLVLMTVPAYDWLWSTHDEALGHKRRYTTSLLAREIGAAGFRIRRLSYAVTLVFPAAVVFRFARRLIGKKDGGSDLAPVPRPLNALLASLMRIEVALLRHVNLPFGLTVVAVAERPADPCCKSPSGEAA